MLTVTEIIIGVLIPIGAYFAGVIRTEKRLRRDDSEARIVRVLQAYMAAALAAKSNSFDGLMKAGVGTLDSDSEIRDLLDRIHKHGQREPVGILKVLQGIDAHKFFGTAVKRGYNFLNSGSPEQLADEIRRGGA